MIPMVDLRAQYQRIKDEIQQGFDAALESGQLILGPNVKEFEREAADFLGVKHAISCASGTDALHLSLVAAGIREGDEVITTPFTFIATSEAIRYVGAVPVFVDIRPDTFNLDPDRVEEAITERTRAIVPVHLFGQPADMNRIMEIADTNDLAVVEDCAQSFGADVGGRMTGGIGLAGAHSFFPSKNLGCYGDGGMISTNDASMAEKLLILRNHGSRERNSHEVLGYNSRLDELQAVVLRAKLKRLAGYNGARRRVAHRYNEQLAGTCVAPPREDGIGTHVYHQYTVLSDRRTEVMKRLAERDIASAIYYAVPLHHQRAFSDLSRRFELPVAEEVCRRCLSLPIFPELSEEHVDQVVAVIRQV